MQGSTDSPLDITSPAPLRRRLLYKFEASQLGRPDQAQPAAAVQDVILLD